MLRAAQAGRAPQLGGQAQLVARNCAAGQGRRIETSVGLTLDWDADLWGELASTEAAAAARLGESEALQRATRLSIAALTARAYVAWREALVDRTQLADAIALQREVARVVQVSGATAD